jgi:tetratricopeptide (TPR) repeat protein
MLKKSFLIIISFSVLIAYGQNLLTKSYKGNGIISKFKTLTPQQLFDTANYYFDTHSMDTALVCYQLLINTPIADADMELQERIIEAHNISGIIYRRLCDYRTAYEFFIKALVLSEKINLDT